MIRCQNLQVFGWLLLATVLLSLVGLTAEPPEVVAQPLVTTMNQLPG